MNNFKGLLQGRKLLIFDFDGTIADTTPLHQAAFESVFKPLNIPVDYSKIAGMKTRDAMLMLCGKSNNNSIALSDEQIDSLVSAKQRCVRSLICDHLQPIPEIDTFLRWARSRYHLAMYSSGSFASVSLALAKLGYSDWFNPLLCAEDVVCAKPDPEGFIKVLALTGLKPSESIVFEDSWAGLEAARRSNIKSVQVALNSKELLLGLLSLTL